MVMKGSASKNINLMMLIVTYDLVNLIALRHKERICQPAGFALGDLFVSDQTHDTI